MVIADHAHAAEVAARLTAEFIVRHSLPPAVFVVAGGSDTARRLRHIPGVLAVLEPGSEGHAGDLPGLSAEEELFIAAWLVNAGQEKKARPGDKLSWDAPGRQPPDLPGKGG
jgi:hypothetical protein